MRQLWFILQRLGRDEEGASVVEYGVLVALIIAAMVVIIGVVGLQIEAGLNSFHESFEAVRST